MSVTEALFAPPLLRAALLYGMLSLGLALLSGRVHGRLQEPGLVWLWDRVYLPMLRAAALVAFLLLAYPVVFGLVDAPPRAALLVGDGRGSALVGLVFLLGLALPLLPLVGRIPGLILPVQGIAAAAILFHWLAGAIGLHPVHYWPGTGPFVLVLLLAIGSHWAATRLAHALGLMLGNVLQLTDLDAAAFELLILVLQVPAILAYTLALGRQAGLQ